jgi:homoserine dehydrogenase
VSDIKHPDEVVRVGLLGAGTVGAEVLRLLGLNKEDFAARVGATLQVKKIVVRDASKVRPGIDPALFTTDPYEVINDPDIDVVVEVMGGIDPAHELLAAAMRNGKAVVTANKALLAKHGRELEQLSDEVNVDFYYEAAVAGAIPIIRSLSESMVGDWILRVMGIVNGTTNYILTKMQETGADFADALKEAQALGYAEADPTADVEGYDAAAKAAILGHLAFHTPVTDGDVFREGITGITAVDIQVAKSMDMVIKLLAIAELTSENEISVRVHPAMLAKTHPLASVRESFNAIFVEAESAGQLMFYGRGAGGTPTASAVLGDIVAIARNLMEDSVASSVSDYNKFKVVDISQIHSRYVIRFEVKDRPGVLAAIASTFAKNDVSLNTVDQNDVGEDAELIVMTHEATEAALSKTVAELSKMDIVKSVASVIRVEGYPS